jgi:hypothetical protein
MKKITREGLIKSALLRQPFTKLPPRVQRYVARALRVRAEAPETAWEIFRWLARHNPDIARTYPTYQDSVPGHGYGYGGQPASRFLWYDMPPVMKMLKTRWRSPVPPGAVRSPLFIPPDHLKGRETSHA